LVNLFNLNYYLILTSTLTSNSYPYPNQIFKANMRRWILLIAFFLFKIIFSGEIVRSNTLSLEITFDQKRISANLNPNPNPKHKAQ